MTGFRIAPGGAQEYFNIRPDISTFAKAIGAGFPVAAFGGTAEVMAIEASNEVMHGGTYTANPLVLAAANAVLQRISARKLPYIRAFHPGQFERWFLSTAHTERDIDITIDATAESMREVAKRIPPTMSPGHHFGTTLADSGEMPE